MGGWGGRLTRDRQADGDRRAAPLLQPSRSEQEGVRGGGAGRVGTCPDCGRKVWDGVPVLVVVAAASNRASNREIPPTTLGLQSTPGSPWRCVRGGGSAGGRGQPSAYVRLDACGPDRARQSLADVLTSEEVI
jgi:hypothetical protein